MHNRFFTIIYLLLFSISLQAVIIERDQERPQKLSEIVYKLEDADLSEKLISYDNAVLENPRLAVAILLTLDPNTTRVLAEKNLQQIHKFAVVAHDDQKKALEMVEREKEMRLLVKRVELIGTIYNVWCEFKTIWTLDLLLQFFL